MQLVHRTKDFALYRMRDDGAFALHIKDGRSNAWILLPPAFIEVVNTAIKEDAFDAVCERVKQHACP